MLYTYTVISWIYMEYSVYIIHVYCYIVDIYGIFGVCYTRILLYRGYIWNTQCMLYIYTVISWIYMEYSVYVIHVYCYIVDIYGILGVCFSTDKSNYKVIQ